MNTNQEIVLNASQFGLEKSRAEQIEKIFVPMVAKFKELEAEYNKVINIDVIDEKICSYAKSLRLKYVKIRTGTDALHKQAKADILTQSKAIDGVRNIVKYAISNNEENLEKIEKHYEIQEAKRKAELKEKRDSQLIEFGISSVTIDTSEMSEDVWNNYFDGVKLNYKLQKEAEAKAEQERIEREKAEEAERKRIIEENKRLKLEQEKLEKERAAEQAAKAEEQRKHEALLAKERAESKAKLEYEQRKLAELKAKEEERERAEQAAKAEEQRKLEISLNASDKDKMLSLSDALSNIVYPEVKSAKAKKIIDQTKTNINYIIDNINKNYR